MSRCNSKSETPHGVDANTGELDRDAVTQARYAPNVIEPRPTCHGVLRSRGLSASSAAARSCVMRSKSTHSPAGTSCVPAAQRRMLGRRVRSA